MDIPLLREALEDIQRRGYIGSWWHRIAKDEAEEVARIMQRRCYPHRWGVLDVERSNPAAKQRCLRCGQEREL